MDRDYQRLPKTMSPAHQAAYLAGFDAAITLFDQYFEKEGIPYEEARFRVSQIKSVMITRQERAAFTEKNNNMINKKHKKPKSKKSNKNNDNRKS